MKAPSLLGRVLMGWVDVSSRRPWIVLVLVLAATVAAVRYTAANLRINTNTDDMLSAELPFRRSQAHFQEAFPQFASGLVFVVDARTPEQARDAAVAFADRLRDRPDLYQHVEVPRAEPFLEAHALYYLDEEELDDLQDRLVEVQPFMGRLTRDESLRGLFGMLGHALDEKADGGTFDLTPVLREVGDAIDATLADRPYETSWQELMAEGAASADDRRQYVLASAVLDYGHLFPAADPIEEARSLFEEVAETMGGAPRLRLTGGLAMEHEELKTVSRGAELIGLLVLVLVAVVLGVGLGSWRLVVASLLTLVVGLLWTAAFAAAAIGHLNLISVAFGVLYIGLGVDYAIHLCLRYRELRGAGRENHDALRTAAGDVGSSLVLCTITTAIGFYAFVPTAYAGVSELGLISGTGMFISLVVTLTLLPALLALLPVPAGKRLPVTAGRWMDLPVRRARTVLALSGLAALGALALLPSVRFDLNPVNLRDPDSESVRTFHDLLETSRTPPWSITILAEDERRARTIVNALASIPEVDRAITIHSFVPDGQETTLAALEDLSLAMGPGLIDVTRKPAPDHEERIEAAEALLQNARRDAFAGDPEVRAFADRLERVLREAREPDGEAVLLRLEHGLVALLPENMRRLDQALSADPFARSDLPESLRRRWVSEGGVLRVEVFPENNLTDVGAMRSFVAAVRTVAPDATGPPVQIVEAGLAVVGAFSRAFTLCIVAIAAVLFLLLRSAKDVLLVLAPLLFAGVLTGAATVLLDVPFNFANVIALPLLLGIGVDSGIHIVHRARMPSVDGARSPLATSTARAVVFSALTTACSFGNLALSPHPGTASLGVVLAVGVAMTLAATLVVLPALLAVDGERRSPGESA